MIKTLALFLIVNLVGSSSLLANDFPAPVYVSLKTVSKVAEFPKGSKWAGGPTMLYETITPDGKRLLVTSPSTQSVYVFDTQSGKQLKIIKVGKASKGIKISPDGSEVYVSNEGENTISVITLKDYKVVAKIVTKKMPHNVRFNKNGDIAYVTLQGGAGLGVIDTKSRKVVKVIPTPGLVGPHNMDLSLDEKFAYVRDTVNHVAVIDLSKEKVIKLIKTGIGHSGIDATADGKFIVTGGIAGDTVTIINSKTLKVVKTLKVGKGPHGIRASKNSRWIYVSATVAGSLVVIDARTLEISEVHRLKGFPFWVAVVGNP